MSLLLTALIVFFPFYIWFLGWDAPILTSVYLLAIGLVKFATCLNKQKAVTDWLMMLIPVVVGLLVLLLKADIALYYPVIISFAFFGVFYASLHAPKNFIQRIAEQYEAKPLDSIGIKYTVYVTKTWCIFLLFNGLLPLFFAWYQLFDLWILYTGFISYLLIGSLLLGERLLRNYIRNEMGNSGTE